MHDLSNCRCLEGVAGPQADDGCLAESANKSHAAHDILLRAVLKQESEPSKSAADWEPK